MGLLNLKFHAGVAVVILLACLSQGCISSSKIQEESARKISATGEFPARTDSVYKIQTGDEIEILVWEQSNFNTTTIVSSLGTIAIPLIGEIQVTGLTHSELKRELTRRLSEYIKDDINLTISIRNNQNTLVSIFGMVTKPDNYPVVDHTSIFKVLSMAGGTTEDANIRNIKIYRKSGDPHYVSIDLTEYLEDGRLNNAVQVHPGDIVYVPRRDNVVRELSDFLRDVVLLFGVFRVVN